MRFLKLDARTTADADDQTGRNPRDVEFDAGEKA